MCCLSHMKLNDCTQLWWLRDNLRRSCTELWWLRDNLHRLRQMMVQIRRYYNLPSIHNHQNGRHAHSVTQWWREKPASPLKFLVTQQNSFSISHLLGTVTSLWLDSNCWQLPAERWLHCHWHFSHCSAGSCQVTTYLYSHWQSQCSACT